jgi:hypothetical protein
VGFCSVPGVWCVSSLLPEGYLSERLAVTFMAESPCLEMARVWDLLGVRPDLLVSEFICIIFYFLI